MSVKPCLPVKSCETGLRGPASSLRSKAVASSISAEPIGGGWPKRCSYFAYNLSKVASCNKVIVIAPAHTVLLRGC